MDWNFPLTFWAVVAIIGETTGILCAFRALMHTRSERGAAAWCIALIAMPFIAVPFYLVFSRRKFSGYYASLGEAIAKHRDLVDTARAEFAPFTISASGMESELHRSLATINYWMFSKENKFDLLIDGENTFSAILSAIRDAETYLLVQFYLFRDDGLGRRFKNALLDKVKEGVRVHFLYDEIGSHSLPKSYLEELADGGVEVEAFGTTRGRANRFQINFRNHRKIVVADGKIAFVGGHNVGDEYLGKDPRFGHWRDTHVRIEGPAALECQAVFLMDWFWATGKIPEVDTKPIPAANGHPALVMPTGPARDFEICQIAHQALISNARQRLWISSPYLVPDEATLVALKFAAKRGVDVRILIPEKRDHLLVYLAGHSFFGELEEAGIRLLRYGPGFLHQKAILVDEQIAGVGTVNLDQRSFLLNFEITAFSIDPEFIAAVASMFESDFESCTPATGADYRCRSLPFRIGVRIARLFAPIL